MQANQSSDKTVDRLIPPASHRPRRLDRPGDLKIKQLLSTFPDNEIQLLNGTLMIPVSAEDARSLGLRIPDLDSFSVDSNSTSSKASALSSVKSAKRSNEEDNKSRKDVKRQRNADGKGVKRRQDGKQERKAQRTATIERLSNFHAKLGRGLRSISNRTRPRQKLRSEIVKENDDKSNADGSARSSIGGRFKRKLNNRDKKSDGLKKDSMTMKQLFSMAESWSSDSMVSDSDNCACCHTKEPCPLHRNEFFDGR
ncbi:uncharacterized protein LOC114871425 [Osmia bicornis bicornis]|uniref:uncharacterized protein LOC114871425 n=1 Tax=Osmia bicornis bicornis TaxID=1437191 RepID=UPI0010F9BD72|nr:uncharacterized protein LOC114871425 [Osmia bicornis bicornis]